MRATLFARAPLAVAAACALTLGLATSASAATVTATRTTVDAGVTYNLSLTAPDTAAASGETITVSGTGYNPNQGVFVALCVVNGAPGVNKPTPCLGGAAGDSGSSWLVNNTWGGSLPYTVKYGPNGSFSVQILVKALMDDGEVCGETVECAVVTRADFQDTNDRKYDVHIPITFQ